MSLPVAILAGGLATRLGPISKQIPKSLIEVGGKPFAEHQLELLRNYDLNRIVFCIGHLGESIEKALGDGKRWGMKLYYSYDGPCLLGTGGALRAALPLLGDAFFVLYGDSYLECDYRRIEEAFLASGKPGLMTVYQNRDQWDRSNVLFQDGRIVRYDKKLRTSDMQHIDYGLGVLQARVFEGYRPEANLDLESVYQDLVARDQLAGFEVRNRFYQIGSLAGLEELRSRMNHEDRKDDLFRKA